VSEGHAHLAEVGLARFSAREVAKRAGYAIGSIYNVFGSAEDLILAINARTLSEWTDYTRARLAASEADPVETMVLAYFDFARANPATWLAIFQLELAGGRPSPAWYQAVVDEFMTMVVAQVMASAPKANPEEAAALAGSLVATVHGHCLFSVFRTFDLLGGADPVAAALTRVREALAGQGREGC
jgi:AcrR family transcriptional regulator